MGKGASSAGRPRAEPGPEPGVRISKGELIATRELLESVMTLASHGILFRVGQILGGSVVAEASASAAAGDPNEAAARVLVSRQFASEVRFFPHKVQVKGSIEVKPGPEATCHVLRGVLHRVVAGGAAGVTVREESCASQGGGECVFALSRGGKER